LLIDTIPYEELEMSKIEVKVPDIGGSTDVEVIELCVAPGDTIVVDDPVIVLESDKATMEIPASDAGAVLEMKVAVGDKLSEGDLILLVEGVESTADSEPKTAPQVETEVAIEPEKAKPTESKSTKPKQLEAVLETNTDSDKVHAGPAVRKVAREFGVELSQVKGTGPKGRILKEDVQQHVKTRLKQGGSSSGAVGSGIPAVKLPDFSQFGPIERSPLSRIHKLTAESMHTSWLNVPHVTQFDEADITEMESFRKAQKAVAEAKGTRLTPLPFILKACAYALNQYPQFNASIDMSTHELIQKRYVNIGVAVDTPAGLVVPVIRDVDKKGLWELAEECIELAGKAKNKKLKPADMQGGCFTISSLGSVGGTAFTPIVNTPEVAILGLSKASIKPVWQENEFIPRLMLPLSLSYDHRAVNGADAARFTTLLGTLLGDLRQLLL